MLAGRPSSPPLPGGPTAAAAATVPVELSEFAIDPSDLSIPVGGVLAVSNVGSVAHDLEVVGEGLATADAVER